MKLRIYLLQCMENKFRKQGNLLINEFERSGLKKTLKIKTFDTLEKVRMINLRFDGEYVCKNSLEYIEN